MSLPNPSDLANIPGLSPWLTHERWRNEFDEDELVESEGLHVASVRIAEDEEPKSHDSDLMLEADVSPRNQTRLFLDYYYDRNTRNQGIRLTTECSCAVEQNCKHAAAALETLTAIITGKQTGGPVARKPISAAHLGIQTAAWLGKIKDAATAPPPTEKPAKPSARFLAYCIELRPESFNSAAEKPFLTLRVGNQKKSGTVIDSATATADPARPAKYLTPEDLVICSQFHARARRNHCWGSSMPLEGPGWEDILIPALATGRLYYGKEARYSRSSSDYAILGQGLPLTVETGWELLADGAARPILRLPEPHLIPILTEPARYVDPQSHQIGPLQSHVSPSLLSAWASGPVIPVQDISLLGQELVKACPENPLPVPDEKPARTLAGLQPTPHLHITEVRVGPYLKRHIGGMLSFRYATCPPVFPLADDAPASNSWLDGKQRIILERDRNAEIALAAQLKDFGLTPLHEIFPAQDLIEKNRHSVVLGSPDASAADWLEFIDGPAFESLNAKGWILESNPSLGLTVHDIGDFFPTIDADTDRKIDWFRFDVTGEFDGKRVSLIPQIARAIRDDWHLRYTDGASLPESILIPCDKPEDGHIRFPAKRFLEMLEQVRHLFEGIPHADGPIRLDRLGAAGLADALAIDDSTTTRSLAELGRNLRHIDGLPAVDVPPTIQAELRHYQLDGFRWLQFLASHGLHGILADDMGLGKTLQTLTHLTARHAQSPGKPSLVIAPTSVVPNWAAEAEKFAPSLKVLVLHGSDRAGNFSEIPAADLVLTSYPLLARDIDILAFHKWHTIVLDEAQLIKNPRALTAKCACRLHADQRLCLSGTPMENHLGELWSLMRFLMPGYLADEKTFNAHVRRPIERDHFQGAQIALNRRISPLILRRTKDQVATELPEKTTLVHRIDLTPEQTDLYESLRAAMDHRVRDAIASKGLAKSHIIVLDALLKLRQLCCHPQLLDTEAAQRVTQSAKLEYLTGDLLPTLLEEGRRILLFSQFTSMLSLIEEHLNMEKIPYLKLTGQTKERAKLVKEFQAGSAPVFLISLKAGGTGLNLTAADTVIHYDPWWNPAAENQATDRAHRIGQTKPVFVHKLVCSGTIEERILLLQNRKATLVKALLSEETTRLKIDSETLSHLLSPLT